MGDESKPDQQKTTEDGALKGPGAPPSWDEILVRASAREVNVPARTAASPPGRERVAFWLKVLTPLLVVVAFVAVKLWGGGLYSRSAATLPIPTQPTTLSGVKPAQEEPLRLDRAGREYVSQLEAMMGRREFRALIESVRNQADSRIAGHPVVQSLEAIARVRSGQRSLELERGLTSLETTLSPAEGQYPDLLHELRVGRVDLILARATSADVLGHNTDTIMQLLGPASRTAYDVDVRIRGARVFEGFADEEMQKGKGVIQSDLLRVREARVQYQNALRLIVTRERWSSLTPISPRANSEVERIVQKMREANRIINGVSLPFTNNDSTTWTGRKGDRVHDGGGSGQ